MTGQIRARRWLFVALAIAMVAVIACGTESSSGAAPAGDQAGDSATAVETVDANETDDTGETDDAAAATGGIDQECVNRILGRAASGFGDVTSAERDRIFSECSGDDDGTVRPPRLGDGTNRDFQFDGGALSAIRCFVRPHQALAMLHSQQQVAAVRSLQQGAGSRASASVFLRSCSGVSSI